jgi:regulator of RNase E activity RraA
MRTDEQKASIRERFLAVDAANVADVLDEMGHPDQGLAPTVQGITGSRLAGWAYTIQGQMAPYEGTGDPEKMTACHGIGPGEISIWSGGGVGVCYFGELSALGMRERGSVGAVVDGGLRDSRVLAEHEFPVFGTYTTAVQSIGRWKVTGHQAPVYLPGATTSRVVVHPGDFVVGDEDGVVVIPDEIVETVLDRSEAITRTEIEVRAALADGMSLAEALQTFGHV